MNKWMGEGRADFWEIWQRGLEQRWQGQQGDIKKHRPLEKLSTSLNLVPTATCFHLAGTQRFASVTLHAWLQRSDTLTVSKPLACAISLAVMPWQSTDPIEKQALLFFSPEHQAPKVALNLNFAKDITCVFNGLFIPPEIPLAIALQPPKSPIRYDPFKPSRPSANVLPRQSESPHSMSAGPSGHHGVSLVLDLSLPATQGSRMWTQSWRIPSAVLLTMLQLRHHLLWGTGSCTRAVECSGEQPRNIHNPPCLFKPYTSEK